MAVVEGGQTRLLEIFESTDTTSALARFEEVGAATEPERAYVRLARLVNARDWEAFEDCFTDDSELVDRRSLAWETIAGAEGNVEMQRSWVKLVPDIEIRLDVLASDDEHIALRWTGVGHAADGGGAVDYAGLVVANVRERHVAHAEIFDRDDEEGALARFEELRSPVEPQPRASRCARCLSGTRWRTTRGIGAACRTCSRLTSTSSTVGSWLGASSSGATRSSSRCGVRSSSRAISRFRLCSLRAVRAADWSGTCIAVTSRRVAVRVEIATLVLNRVESG